MCAQRRVKSASDQSFRCPHEKNFVFLAIQNDDSDHTTQGTFSDAAAQISVMDEVKT